MKRKAQIPTMVLLLHLHELTAYLHEQQGLYELATPHRTNPRMGTNNAPGGECCHGDQMSAVIYPLSRLASELQHEVWHTDTLRQYYNMHLKLKGNVAIATCRFRLSSPPLPNCPHATFLSLSFFTASAVQTPSTDPTFHS